MGDTEAFTSSDFRKVAVQLITGSKADRVDDAVQSIPLLAQFDEYLIDLGIIGNIAREAQLRT